MERDVTTMIVARNIESLMAERQTDPAKLARDARLGPTGIYDILNGKSRSPKIDTIAKIARALGVPVSKLFEDRQVPDLRDDLLSLFGELPERERQLLLQTARAWIATQRTA